MKELSCVDIASFIVKRCAISNYFINLTKLQKLVYCCYGVVLTVFNRRLCEQPRAATNGPVFDKLYSVTSRDGLVQYLIEYKDQCNELSDPERVWLEKTIDAYVRYPAKQLVEWSMLPNSPWFFAKKAKLKHLDDQIIKDYFEKRLIR